MPKGFAGIKDIVSFPKYVLSKDRLDERLALLKQSPVPPPKPRAMCYSIRPPSPEDQKTFSYVCPLCGRRTTHSVYKWDILFELDQIRDASQSLREKGFEIYLDDKNLCSNCCISSDTLGKLFWKITIGERTHSVRIYGWKNDYSILTSFLSAHDKSDYDKLMAELSGDLSRLEILLGGKNG